MYRKINPFSSGHTTLATLLLFGSAIIIFLFTQIGYIETWELWNIATFTPHFGDLRSITAGSELYSLGLDPFLEGYQDPAIPKMNYPRVWLWLSFLGVTQTTRTTLGLIIIALFIVGIMLFTKEIDHKCALLLAFCCFSPTILLGIERGNNDLLIFFILALSLFILDRAPTLTILLLNLGTILKLFPIFGLLVFFSQERSIIKKAGLITLPIIILYALLTYNDLIAIKEATPNGTIYAYGVNVFGTYVGQVFGSPFLTVVLRYLFTFSLLLIGCLVLYTHTKHKLPLPKSSHTPAFLLGSGIYLGTFMLGNNFNYRFIFLLFTIPQLLLWCRVHSKRVQPIAQLALISIIFSLWADWLLQFIHKGRWGPHIAFSIDEIANGFIFITLLYFAIFYIYRSHYNQ